jgi:hypothetical protein
MSNRIETGGGYVVRELDDAGEPTDRFKMLADKWGLRSGQDISDLKKSERAADAYIARMREGEEGV